MLSTLFNTDLRVGSREARKYKGRKNTISKPTQRRILCKDPELVRKAEC